MDDPSDLAAALALAPEGALPCLEVIQVEGISDEVEDFLSGVTSARITGNVLAARFSHLPQVRFKFLGTMTIHNFDVFAELVSLFPVIGRGIEQLHVRIEYDNH